MRKPIMKLAMALALASPGAVHASEGGGSAYAHGAEGLDIAVLPPPGTYLLNYAQYYTAGRVNDGNGNSVVPDFSVHVFAEIPRFVHVTNARLFGATLAMQVFVPVVDMKIRAGGVRDHKFGLGDIIVSPIILGWNANNWHFVATVDTFIPTGRYNRNDLANLGRNHWTFEPVFAVSYKNPAGGPEVSAKFMYDFNTRNSATSYRSGEEFHIDAGASWNFDPLTVGVVGYYYKQTTADKQYGLRVGPDGNKGEAFALGPAVRMMVGNIPITAQWQHEFVAENRSQGDKFWIKMALRF